MTGWRIAWSYMHRHRYSYLIGIGFVAAANVVQAFSPWVLGHFTDRLQQGNINTSQAAGYAALLTGIGLSRVIMGWLGRLSNHNKGRVLAYELRQQLFQKWETLSPVYYQRHSIGDLLSHALSDVEVVRELVSMGANVITNVVFMLGTTLFVMAVKVDWRLTLASLVPLVFIPFFVRYLGPKIRIQSQRSQEALGRMAQTVEESIGGIRAIKAFGNERVIIGRFEQKVDDIFDEKILFVRLSALFSSLVPLMATLSFLIVFSYGGFLTINKVISLGDFVAFTMYVAMLRGPLEHLGQVINLIQRASASLDRLSELLNVIPDVRDREGRLIDRPLQGDLQVEKLSFSYPGTERKVLTDITFTVKRGKTLGIVGSTGSGKTTLVNLLLRVYDPPEGTIYIDGEDLFRYPLARLRDGIAYVPQDGFLFSATILENIAFSEPEPNEERAERSARITAVYDNIRHFPEGFETEIGERGVRLSGGQKQRLAIARMIYKDAPVLILDDSLSAVDTGAERMILKNLRITSCQVPKDGSVSSVRSVTKNKTTIIVSHRLSAVQHADEIIVLEEGRIVERGNHAKLMLLNSLYARLFRMQSGLIEEVGT